MDNILSTDESTISSQDPNQRLEDFPGYVRGRLRKSQRNKG